MGDPIPFLDTQVHFRGCHNVKSFHIRCLKCCQSLAEPLPEMPWRMRAKRRTLSPTPPAPNQQTQLDGKHLLMRLQHLLWVKRHYSYWTSVIISAVQLTLGSVPCPPFKHPILTRKHISAKCWGKLLTTVMI